MIFEERKTVLLEEALKFQGKKDVTSKFQRDFFTLVEKVIINMLSKEEDFFGQFMIKVRREIRLDIAWPVATIAEVEGFKMYFNPLLFLFATEREMAALFKHEIYHIMYSHYEREKALREKYSAYAVNLALDIAINQFIKDLPVDAKKLETVCRELDVELSPKEACEVYTEKIERALNKRIITSGNNQEVKDSVCREVNMSKAHEVWSESEMNKTSTKEITKKVAISAYNGKAPKDLVAIIEAYNTVAEISWQELLKKLVPALRAGYKKTVTRRNRRQPDRMDLRGVLPNSIPEILVAIDISASMSDKEIEKIMIEIIEIASVRKNKITVIECDNEVRNIYEVKTKRDIRARARSKGATKFSPVFKYMKDNNLRNQILVYFTDGVGEEELTVKPVNKHTIWVLTAKEELSLKKPIGEVKRINGNNKGIEGNYGETSALDILRAATNAWEK